MQFWLPDSPRWLLLSGAGKSRAEKDLVRARGSTADAAAVQRELAGIEKSVREAQAMADPGMHLLGRLLALPSACSCLHDGPSWAALQLP